MKIRFITLILLSIAVVFITVNESSPANAQTIPYTYAYNATNLYTDDVVYYEFSGLDTSTAYGFGIYTVDIETGANINQLSRKVVGPGTTTGSWFFGVPVIGVSEGSWPDGYTGPIRVIDSFGNVIGEHFVTEPPLTPDAEQVWETSSGIFAFQTKQVIGNLNDYQSGACRSVVNNAINASGLHHGYEPCQSTTKFGDIALLHFQFDPIGYVAPTTDEINIINLSLGSSALSLTIDLDDICEYQELGVSAAGCNTYTAFDSFLVINTGPGELPWVNYQLADVAFTLSGSLNPMRWGAPRLAANNGLGAYSCYREVAAVATSDCESVWLVSNDATSEVANSTEWEINLLDKVKESGTQQVIFNQDTEQIWDAYHGAYTFEDTTSGYSDTTIYSYVSERTDSYTVFNSAVDDVFVYWALEPVFVHSVAVAVVPDDYVFITAYQYDITPVTTFAEAIDQALNRWGTSQTALGRTLVQVVVLIGAMMVVAWSPARGSVLAYMLVWTAVGGGWTIAGLSSDVGALVWGIITVALWVMVFVIFPGVLTSGGRSDEQNA